ncbi:MAG: 4Fe-4S binding protein [Blautia sp.]|nr:4Fe-4S binding protein [Blautia sp.]
MKRIAIRNLRLCTKDCLCLFSCPTGATDTENSIIDTAKCIGCGACADACPSKAISLVPVVFPKQQEKTDAVVAALREMAQRKADQEKMVSQIAESTEQDGLYRLMTAIGKSTRLLGADLMRESRFMLPQSEEAREVLQTLADNPPTSDFPLETVKELLESL